MKFYSILGLNVFLWVGCTTAFAKVYTYNDLSRYQKENLPKGQQMLLQPNFGSPWDQVTTFQIVDATPAEAAAVFTQYSRHKEFFKNMDQSTPEGVVGKETTVAYTVKIHVLMFNVKESYSVTDVLSLEKDVPGGYQVSWTLKRPSKNTEKSFGSVRFEPYGDRQTLMIYDNAVKPKENAITKKFLDHQVVKDFAVRLVREISTQLKDAIEREKHINYNDLQAKVKDLEDKLASNRSSP